MSDRFTMPELLMLAGRAIGRIDARGPRGAEQASHDEIIAMATLLVLFGIAAIPPSPTCSRGTSK